MADAGNVSIGRSELGGVIAPARFELLAAERQPDTLVTGALYLLNRHHAVLVCEQAPSNDEVRDAPLSRVEDDFLNPPTQHIAAVHIAANADLEPLTNRGSLDFRSLDFRDALRVHVSPPSLKLVSARTHLEHV
jgi:hypothetical protein